jgi:SAM-dependent methyltransferase
MHRQLLDLLICPGCLPDERPLAAHGLACMLPSSDLALVSQYTETPVVSAYLWSHYADLFGDPDRHDAYLEWSSLLGLPGGLALDIGCAVGRLTFELGRQADFAIGIDRSHAFIQTARALARDGQLTFGLVMEGDLAEYREIRLPACWPRERVEFILADALALPFPRSVFQRSSSLNLLDKLPEPLRHLQELNRVMAVNDAQTLISDPWSWSTDIAPKTAWLGGVPQGPFAGHGHLNLRRLLETGLEPAWQVIDEGTVKWTIRNHRNHFERIYSDFLLAKR